MSRTFLFVGPSLPEAARLLSGETIEILPPIAAGDLLRLDLAPGDVVGIVDGYFHHVRAVRHKEILAALAAGAQILGASSIGALRAAELHSFGMIGVGQIFEDYRDGRLEGDDEVALMHAAAEDGYRALSEPLVNVRATLLRAEERGFLDHPSRDRLVRVLGGMPYAERSYARLFEAAREIGVSPAARSDLERLCVSAPSNPKREDALQLVGLLRRGGRDLPAREQAFSGLNTTSYLRSWQLDAQRTDQNDGAGLLRDMAVLRACQLFATDYPAFYRALVLDWLSAQCTEQCADSIVQCDVGGRARTLRAIEHGAHQGFYRSPLEGPGMNFLEQWMTPVERRVATREEQLALFLVRSFRVGRGMLWDDFALEAIKYRAIFARARRLVRAAVTVNDQAAELRSGFELTSLSKSRIVEWFAKQWAVEPHNFELAVMDRGFSSIDGFLVASRSFYLLTKYNPSMSPLSVAA